MVLVRVFIPFEQSSPCTTKSEFELGMLGMSNFVDLTSDVSVEILFI